MKEKIAKPDKITKNVISHSISIPIHKLAIQQNKEKIANIPVETTAGLNKSLCDIIYTNTAIDINKNQITIISFATFYLSGFQPGL